MIEFFENLKQKRLEKNLSLKKIAEKTLLNLSVLNDIENGEIDKLPKGYRRIYLRRYVQEIGLNPDEVMRDYDLLVGDVDVELIQDNSEDRISLKKEGFLKGFSREKMIHYLSVFGILIVFIFLVWGVFYIMRTVNLTREYKVQEMSMDEMVNSLDSLEIQDSINNAVLPVKQDCTKTQTPSFFSVEIEVIDNCWIKQIVDFKDTTEYILKPGIVKKVSALSQIKIIAGNGNAIRLIQNGKTYDNLAPKGAVLRRLVIGRNGILEKIHTFPRKQNKSAPDSLSQEGSRSE